jgi:cyanophycinase
MVAGGAPRSPPRPDMARLATGLGFLRGVVIDQHFSERGRLPRLFSALAQQPTLLGLGIDEDTALVVSPFHSIEVVGSGAVTVLDGGRTRFECVRRDDGDALQLEHVLLHLLPAGRRYLLGDGPPAEGDRIGIAKLVATLTAQPDA